MPFAWVASRGSRIHFRTHSADPDGTVRATRKVGVEVSQNRAIMPPARGPRSSGKSEASAPAT